MNTRTIHEFYVIGISVRTTNENEQAMQDIPALWDRFMTEGIAAKIPHKTDDDVLCLYTDYESDQTRPYTTILGCRVSGLENTPGGMVGKTVTEGTYVKHTAQGNSKQGMVAEEWKKIWHSDVDRAFTTDFEVYGKKAQNPDNAEVDIFVALRQTEQKP